MFIRILSLTKVDMQAIERAFQRWGCRQYSVDNSDSPSLYDIEFHSSEVFLTTIEDGVGLFHAESDSYIKLSSDCFSEISIC